jgi:hypothetical protein
VGLSVAALAVPLGAAPARPQQAAPTAMCAPGGPPVAFGGAVTPEDARTYQVHPFDVAEGTTRIEVTYDWSDLTSGIPGGVLQTVFDLGLWDQHGYRDTAGFRGWSGSRQGRVAAGQDPVVIQQDEATRGYRPAPIEAGTWWLEIGVAAVSPTGADWSATVTCTDPPVGPPSRPDPVDPDHVVTDEAGWYHGDFHVHGFHSASDAPPWDDIVEQARAAGLEVLPVTDYVTGQHWDELGAVQAANPDVLLWPGREIITYFGHAVALGETRSTLEYRHGFEGVSLADVQRGTIEDGALFQIAHPTIFPGPVFANVCRGCEFTLGHVIDWTQVQTIEVVTGPILASSQDLGLPDLGGLRILNPFVRSAIELWEDLLLAGFRITAVSGSDSKANESPDERVRVGIGSSATVVRADALSQAALGEGLRAGRAYIKTLGPRRSPGLEVVATGADGSVAGIGDDLAADVAELTVTVTGGHGDTIALHRNGEPYLDPVPVTSDPFAATFTLTRDLLGEGPLGTFVRVETYRPIDLPDGTSLPHVPGLPADADLLRYPTTLTNPVFLTGAAGATPAVGGPSGPGTPGATLPATGPGGSVPAPALLVALLAVVALRLRPRPA